MAEVAPLVAPLRVPFRDPVLEATVEEGVLCERCQTPSKFVHTEPSVR